MARQTSIIASAVTPASLERVWEIACDSSRYPEWVENTLRMIRTDGPTRAGATMEELTRIAGPWNSVTPSTPPPRVWAVSPSCCWPCPPRWNAARTTWDA
jgi:hypothetical protein